jgi:hypothetical protein
MRVATADLRRWTGRRRLLLVLLACLPLWASVFAAPAAAPAAPSAPSAMQAAGCESGRMAMAPGARAPCRHSCPAGCALYCAICAELVPDGQADPAPPRRPSLVRASAAAPIPLDGILPELATPPPRSA